MRKKDLLNLPEIKITKEIVDTAMNDKPIKHTGWGSTYYTYNYKEYYRAKVYDGILKVVIFTRDDVIRKKPSYEIYISKEEKRYLTYDTRDEKWRTAKIDNLDSSYGYYEEKRYYCRDAEKTIIEYLNSEKQRGYEAILDFQLSVKKEALQIAHRRITDRIDSMMELVPQLPRNFDNWAEKTAMINSRYIYYVYSRNVNEGYCTNCKQMVPVEKPKHNTEGICKKCRSHIVFKAVKKAAVVYDRGYASIFQKTREGFIWRYYELAKEYKDYMKPEFAVCEAFRIFYDKDFSVTGEYEWMEFKNTGVMRWCQREEKPYSYNSYQSYARYMEQSTLYHSNLKKVFEGTEFQYSAIDLFAKGLNGDRFHPCTYLNEYKRNKFLEYLVKLKLYKIVNGYLDRYYDNYLNEEGKRIHEVLKVTKEQVKQLCDMKASWDELGVLQKANKEGVKLTSSQIQWISENISVSSLIKYMRFKTPHKIIRYIKEQQEKENIRIRSIASDYKDYLETIERLGYDLINDFVFFPKHLKQSHDAAMEEFKLQEKRIEKMEEDERDIEMGKIAEKLVKRYSMKDKKFTIRIPWTCEEIRNEGHKLHHCVRTYVNKILSKETAILFIRKTSAINKPFYTMEIRNGKVKQVRGKNNCDPTPEVEAFVNKFKRKKLQAQLEREAV